MPTARTALLVSMAVLLVGAPAAAVSIRFEFEAQYNGSGNDSPDGTVGPLFRVGDILRGRYSFESTTPGVGFFPGVTRLRFDLDRGRYTGAGFGGDILVTPIPANNFYQVVVDRIDGLRSRAVGDNQLSRFKLSVNGDFLGGSNALLLVPPPVTPLDDGGANTDRIELLFRDKTGATSGAAFDLLSLTVPEPAAALLAASALLSLGARLRRA